MATWLPVESNPEVSFDINLFLINFQKSFDRNK